MDLNGKTILIVDDDRIIAMAQASFLNKQGINTLTAGTGEEVFEILGSGADCHMVLLDIDLGNGMSGPDIARKILEIRDIPLVFVTSHVEGDMTGRIKDIKKYGYVLKNSGDFVILAAIETAFELFYERDMIVEAGKTFEQIANTSPALLWMSDTEKNFTWFNNRWLSFTGRKIEDELGDGWAEGIHPDDKEMCLREYIRAFNAREPFTVSYRLRRSDGEYRRVINSGYPKFSAMKVFEGYIGSSLDITEMKKGD